MLLIYCLFIFFVQAGEIKELTANVAPPEDLSTENIKKWETTFKRYEQGEIVPLNELPKDFDESFEGPWQTIGGACSLYCGDEIYKQAASSELSPSKTNTYTAQNAHDLDLRTAWTEGKEDYGIGESITFHIKPNSPSINQINIWNGYHKSKDLYTKNSRPKTLKVYVNGEVTYLLHLQDSLGMQYFTISPLRSEKEGVDVEIKFEIVDVYKGTKWKDTVISEIGFSGSEIP